MSDSFFEKLQDHSEVKLSILKNYIVPWMRKITLHRANIDNKCLLIDGFAGCGFYDDGEYGSPLIMIDAAIDYTDQCKDCGWKSPQILIRLNELNRSNYFKLIESIKTHFNFTEGIDRGDRFLCINPDYTNIQVTITNDSFERFFEKLLDVKKNYTLIPSICFVDPFGYSNTPFELFKKYLGNEKAELIINFIYEEVNRFIKVGHQKEIMDKQFGCDIAELIETIEGSNPQERQLKIIDCYTTSLESISKLVNVRHFILKKLTGQTKMILFFATKSIAGLGCMKDAMFRHSSSYSYDPRKKQMELFELPDQQLNNLSEILHHKFARKKVSIETIEEFVLINTVYPTTNYCKKALKKLEIDGNIINVDGRSKKYSYPKYCMVYFR